MKEKLPVVIEERDLPKDPNKRDEKEESVSRYIFIFC